MMGGKKTEGGAKREHPAQLRLNRKLKNNTEFWLKYMGLLELNSSLFPVSNKRHHLPLDIQKRKTEVILDSSLVIPYCFNSVQFPLYFQKLYLQ